MANQMGLVSKAKLIAIANAIRAKLGVSTQYSLDDMPTAIESISGGGGGGGITPSGTIQITENGTFDVTQYASAAVNVSGGSSGGWELISEFTASEDVETINMEIPSAKRGMNVYKVQLTGETSASEWLYFKANSTGRQTNGAYMPQLRQYDVSFFASKRGLNNGGYSIPAYGNSSGVSTTVNIENIFMNLYNSSSRFKSGFNVKLWGIN